MTVRRSAIAVAVVATALAAGSFVPAGAQPKTDSFSGSCTFPGTVYFDPPATFTPQDLDVTWTSPGRCSGTLNGQVVTNVSVQATHTAVAPDSSCNEAHARGGEGAIRFPRGQVIRYHIDFDSIGTHVTFKYRGQRSGSGTGTGSFLTPRTPPDVALRCGSEEGVSSTPLDVNLQTETPLVSERGKGLGRD